MARRSARLIAASQATTATSASAAAVQSDAIPAHSTSKIQNVVPARQPAGRLNPEVVCFLDLAGEIRNQIYGELLPDVEILKTQREKCIRKDGQRASTNFMATCRQIYNETISMLYPATISEQIEVMFNSKGAITMLGKQKPLSLAKPADFSVLKRVQRLTVHVNVGINEDFAAVCDVQDAMFFLCKTFQRQHNLQHLYVHITMGKDRTSPYHGLWDMWDFYEYGYGNVGRMQEFKGLQPGDISRAHSAAFLTDPLRTLRRVRKGNRNGSVYLDFPGRTGRPWRELNGQVCELMSGDTPIPEYNIFSEYFVSLRLLRTMISQFKEANKQEFTEQVVELSKARIRGDLQTFRKAHDVLMALIDPQISGHMTGTEDTSYEQVLLREQRCRELIYIKIHLKEALPSEDSDVSFFGYNIADNGLHEWQTVGRKVEREAKRKRKADKNEKADLEAFLRESKKAKTSEED